MTAEQLFCGDKGMFQNTISAGFFLTLFKKLLPPPPSLKNVKTCRIGVNLPLPFFLLLFWAEHSVKIAPDADKKIPLAQARKRTSSKKSINKEEKPHIVFHCKFWQMGGTTQEQFTILRLTFIQGLSFDTSGVGPNPTKHTTFQIMR